MRFTVTMVSGLALFAAPRPALSQAVSSEVFADELAGWHDLAAACAKKASACRVGEIPDRQQVSTPDRGSFPVPWAWLQDALQAAGKASDRDRERLMAQVEAHLAELGAEATGSGERAPATDFNKARETARAVLARAEFRSIAEGPGWFDRQIARLQDALLRLFSGVGRLGDRAPWLAPVLEWSCFGLLAAALLWSIRRNLGRQTLQISLRESAVAASGRRLAAEDWLRKAEEHAGEQAWRDAVHFLYWGAIALLEERRSWKPNATRTPREYLRLLRSGSEAQMALRELTTAFERTWYGSAVADRALYLAALASYRALATARPQGTGQGLAAANSTSGFAAAGGA